jgi:hypothetical protein
MDSAQELQGTPGACAVRLDDARVAEYNARAKEIIKKLSSTSPARCTIEAGPNVFQCAARARAPRLPPPHPPPPPPPRRNASADLGYARKSAI